MTRTTVAAAAAGAILLSVTAADAATRKHAKPLSSGAVPPSAGRSFPTARSSADTTTRPYCFGSSYRGYTFPDCAGQSRRPAARTRRRLDKRARRARAKRGAGLRLSGVLESPQKELARRKIGKVFRQDAANIQLDAHYAD